MKKYFVIVLIGTCIILEFNSCSKIANIIAQAIGWQGVDVTISVPPIPDTAAQVSIGSCSFSYNLDSFIKAQTANTLGMSNIDTLRFTSCTLTIQNPDNNDNFANFESASASFSTTTNTTATSLGSISDNPNTYANTLTLPVNSTVNLRSYLPSSGPVTINYSCAGQLRAPTTTTLNVTAHIQYYIHVTP